MFRSTAPRATPQPTHADDRATPRGRHHRAVRDQEKRARQDAVERARRRTSQVDAYQAVSGPIPTATPARRSAPERIDNVRARRDPLTSPFPAAPSLPGARRPQRTPARTG
ncbi:hypothetical protein LQ327_02850 [Actinomycetospora endophytica]|uniref:Uncharacterized protein n=1 Tax=Actinomycetospora endophytica TaxID=2291215 RepID=A0ABS8P471_9PSEU|nr:hypothetical protein [Actinomycetospora endophytica]MCD2192335.1 hypothetical protein [Actinomycetospora endophytica]